MIEIGKIIAGAVEQAGEEEALADDLSRSVEKCMSAERGKRRSLMIEVPVAAARRAARGGAGRDR